MAQAQRSRRRGKAEELPTKQQWSSLKYIPKLFFWVYPISPIMTLSGIFLRLSQALIPLGMLWVGKEILDELIFLFNEETPTYTKLIQWVAIELVLAIVNDLISRLTQLVNVLLGEKFSNASSIKLLRHAAYLSLVFYEDPAFYDKLEKARQQTNNRVYILWEVLNILQRLLSIVFLSIGLLAYFPWLLPIVFISVIPTFLSENKFNILKRSVFLNYTESRRELDYLRWLGASDQTAREVKMFGLTDFISDRFKTKSEEYYNENKNLSVKSSIWGGLFFLLSTLAYYFCYAWILKAALLKTITLGEVTFLSGSFMRIRDAMLSLVTTFSDMTAKAAYLQDFFDFFELETEKPEDRPYPVFPNPILKGFEFQNVSFCYPGTDTYAVKNLSFSLGPTEKLALVGENGAGKTTLIKLLCRLYTPTEGRILLDGVDISSLHPEEYRKRIGVIFQDFVQYQFLAKENIAVGDIEALENELQIQSAANKSLADEVLSQLPEGMNQMLGKKFLNGVNLSGGQWQKIAIARAYMRDASLFILDEPTAALDARAEHDVFQRFTQLMKGKAAVLISHRFSTVRMADTILFLENGQIIERGSHEELIAIQGKYAHLFNLQAKGYQ